MASINTSAIDLVARILAAGQCQGVFQRNADAVDVHMLISSLCTFRFANRHTFKAIFGRDLVNRRLRKRYRQMVGDVVLAYLKTSNSGT